jgi:hypothetical protein
VIAVTDLSAPVTQFDPTEINNGPGPPQWRLKTMTKYLTAAIAAAALSIIVLSTSTTSAEAFPRGFFGYNLSGTDLGSGR